MDETPSFLNWLDPRDWIRLRAHAEQVTFEEGEYLLRQGDPPVWMFVLEAGTIEVVDGRTSPPTVLATLQRGQILGEMSFLDGVNVSADVRAMSEVECHRFSIDRLYNFFRSYPELDAAFHRAIAHTVSGRARLLRTSALLGGFGPQRADALDSIAPDEGPTQIVLRTVLGRLEQGIELEVDLQGLLASALGCDEAALRDAAVSTLRGNARALEALGGSACGLSLADWLLSTLSPRAEDASQTVDAVIALGVDPNLAVALVDAERPVETIPLDRDRVRIGHWSGCEVVLPDSRLAPVHAELIRDGGNWRAVSVGPRPLVVGDGLVASAPVRAGDVIHVGRYALTLKQDTVEVRSPSSPHALHVEGVTRKIRDTAILSDIEFSLLSGEVLAVVGPSGSGKSSLLAALRGQFDEGAVWLDTRLLPELLEESPTLAGEVPQDDIVHAALTVQESLETGAALRNPGQPPRVRSAQVRRVIEELGLARVCASRIGDPLERGLSGGQRKRVNIAQELLGDDTVLVMLDEPTSGLDPRSSAELARLSRRLADHGRMVVLVSHDLSDALLTQIDHLLVLAEGGHVTFYGPPEDACRYFGVGHASEIFDRLSDRTQEQWRSAFRDSEVYEEFTRGRRRAARQLLAAAQARAHIGQLSLWSALPILLRRDIKLKLRDPGYRAVWLAQPLMVIAVVWLVFSGATSGLVFLLVLASLWFGMSSSVRDLLADRVVWRREARLGVPAFAWVLSRTLVTSSLVALQCVVLALAAVFVSPLLSMGYSAPGLTAAMLLCSWVGVSTGMAIGAMWKRADAAFGTVVLLLLPQIAFSGILMPLDQLHGLARLFSTLTPIRYGFHLALVTGERLQYLRLGSWSERPVSGELFLMGLRPSGEGELGMSPSMLVASLLAMGMAGILVSVWLHRRSATS